MTTKGSDAGKLLSIVTCPADQKSNINQLVTRVCPGNGGGTPENAHPVICGDVGDSGQAALVDV